MSEIDSLEKFNYQVFLSTYIYFITLPSFLPALWQFIGPSNPKNTLNVIQVPYDPINFQASSIPVHLPANQSTLPLYILGTFTQQFQSDSGTSRRPRGATMGQGMVLDAII